MTKGSSFLVPGSRFGLILIAALACAAPAAAQTATPAAFSVRPFMMFSQQQFAAKDTFEAVFGESVYPFRGGGVDVVLFRDLFVEVGWSQFEKTGQRVFRFNDQIFGLGIPLTSRVTPFEVTGGYRFTRWRRVIPYGGVGAASFSYRETSDFSEDAENAETSKTGLVVIGGVEVRLHRWVGLGLDAHHSQVTGIIGEGGISEEFAENDLGGTAFRFKIMIGR